jgi:glycosyltransferase involved in cell wall biosynthesis
MAVGVPVVSTRVSAIPELVEDGRTGTLVEPENPEALAWALAEVLLHRERFEGQLREARKKVESVFDNRNCIGQLHALFREALSPP